MFIKLSVTAVSTNFSHSLLGLYHILVNVYSFVLNFSLILLLLFCVISIVFTKTNIVRLANSSLRRQSCVSLARCTRIARCIIAIVWNLEFTPKLEQSRNTETMRSTQSSRSLTVVSHVFVAHLKTYLVCLNGFNVRHHCVGLCIHDRYIINRKRRHKFYI